MFCSLYLWIFFTIKWTMKSANALVLMYFFFCLSWSYVVSGGSFNGVWLPLEDRYGNVIFCSNIQFQIFFINILNMFWKTIFCIFQSSTSHLELVNQRTTLKCYNCQYIADLGMHLFLICFHPSCHHPPKQFWKNFNKFSNNMTIKYLFVQPTLISKMILC